ncbi:MFS transporter [Kitasatospora aureofaciens]|uniref:MFS transporter n=2 Tax=Kitasatospora aureofaciens TaxID=1894 RepID=A0A1E7NCU8_KITAU|nr:MFS transporter [Kitasatospora aureofaciens]QEU98643.1 MFS transporter [Streptomyces viridifaciens]ARF82098.1 MFS transporter [Kitasatospora aureofaciens]OEV38505.1 MFS transporter [Kitasatospora aureofaciens]UKZ04610.1 MFS transporter [Streptomyces viridifaciens]GGU84508.1 MFS transporter [Kitasatospora aureofaciens]
MPTPHPRRLAWASRNFRIQTAATVVSGLGNAGAPIATAFAVLGNGGTTAEVGYVTAARLLPTVLLLVVGGTLADRLPRHRIMVAANLFSAAAQAVLAVLVLAGDVRLWQLLVLSAAGGAGYALYSPAAGGMIMQAVPQEHANRAFSVFRMGQNGSQIGGAALGGGLTAVCGPGWVLALDAFCFLVAAVLRFFLAPEAAPAPSGGSMLRDLREGWREFSSRRWLWVVVAQFAVLVACINAVESVYGPAVADQRLGGAGAWGLAMSAYGVGLVVTGLLMARWRPRRILLVGNWGVFLFGVPALALALEAPLPLLIAAMFLSGVGVTVFAVNWMVALQQEVPEEMFSRVTAYDELGSYSLAPVGTALAGPAAVALGLSGALWACAALCLVLSAVVLIDPQVRRLTRRDPRRSSPDAPVSAVEPAPAP